MKITILYGLPFVSVKLHANNKTFSLEHVLLDTGSAATIFKTDHLAQIDVVALADDKVRLMSGIGGSEPVIEKQIKAIELENLVATPFTIQMGALDYSIAIDGILGFDFLRRTGAKINIETLEIS